MAVAISTKSKELLDFCVDHIKSHYTKELFDFYNKDRAGNSDTRVTEDQEDIRFSYWELDSRAASITDVPVEDIYEVRNYFPNAFCLGFKSLNLPKFFDRSYADLPKEFLTPFKEKTTALAVEINNCMKEIKALKETLMDPKMTLTSIKKDYPELYNLIKS